MTKACYRKTIFLLAIGAALSVAEEWQWQNPLPQGNVLSSIRIRPESSELMIVGGAGTVMRSQNQGENWNFVHYAGGTRENLYALFFLNNTTIFASGSGGTMLCSNDGGYSWVEYKNTTTPVNQYALWFWDENNGITVGNMGYGFRTTDGGLNWSRFSLETDQSLEDIIFLDRNKGFITGYGGKVFKTTDGGENWTLIDVGTTDDLWAIDFADASNGLIVGSMGTALRTTDGGENWSVHSIGAVEDFWDVDLVNPTRGYAVGSNGIAYRTDDGGENWAPLGLETEFTLRSVCFFDENTGFAVGLAGTIYKTTDGGASWEPKSHGPRNSFLDVAFPAPLEGWVVGEGGQILHTMNGGIEWIPQASGVDAWLMSLSFTSTSGYVVGSNGTILKTENSGEMWTPLNSGTTVWFNDVFFIDDNTGIVTGDNGLLMKTVNGGGEWIEKTSGTSYHLMAAHFPSPGTGFIVGWGGTILKTSDGGENWSALNSNIPDNLNCVYFFDDQMGYAGGAGGMLLKTTNGGADWMQLDSRTEENLYKIYFFDGNVGYITASQGTILCTENGGIDWIAEKWVDSYLRSVCMVSPSVGYVVGYGGIIIRFQRPALILAKPVLTNPDNDQTGVPASPRLEWNAVDNATSYQVQISTNSTMDDIFRDESDIQDTHVDFTYLEHNRDYFWRVRAAGDGTISLWSDTWMFRIQFEPVELTGPEDNENDVPITVTLHWNSIAGASQYRIMIARDQDWTDIVWDQNISSTSFSPYNLAFGTRYFWRVAGNSSSNQGAWSETWKFDTIEYPDQIDVNKNFEFPYYAEPGDYKATDYQLFGIPGNSNILLGDILGGSKDKDWRVVWDNGEDQNYWKYYDGTAQFSCTQGRAFWLVHRGSVSIDRKVHTAPLNDTQEAQVEIHDKWNLITNPFPFPVSWTLVQAANGFSQPLWKFNTGFQETSTLDPYQGYYYFNSSGSRVSLNIPVRAGIGKNMEMSKTEDWRLTILLTADAKMVSSAWIGVSDYADPGLDRFEYRKPRAPGAVASVYFNRPEWDDAMPAFANDVRPPFSDLEEWEFSVTLPDDEPVELCFENPENVPGTYEIYLVNKHSGRVYNLGNEGTVQVRSTEKEVPFILLVGTAEAIEYRVGDFLPDDYMLGNNFPNPFNATTSIPVYVPERSFVDLSVYNVLGEKISTVYIGYIETGMSTFVWDSCNPEGEALPSGVYYYRLKAGAGTETFVRTRKLVMIK